MSHTRAALAELLNMKPEKNVWLYKILLPPWTETETAYIAGIIDGEGCIRMAKQAKYGFHVSLSVTNTDKNLVEWLRFMFGQNRVYSLGPGLPTWKKGYSVQVQSMQRFYEILMRVAPYLRVKRRQAELGIQFCEWRQVIGSKCRNRPYTPEERMKSEAIVLEFRSLNKKGSQEP